MSEEYFENQETTSELREQNEQERLSELDDSTFEPGTRVDR